MNMFMEHKHGRVEGHDAMLLASSLEIAPSTDVAPSER